MPKKTCPICRKGFVTLVKKLQRFGRIFYLYRCSKTDKLLVGNTLYNLYEEVTTTFDNACFAIQQKIEQANEARTQYGEGSRC